ncbi:hypothetical protein G6F62_007250 [Rhizopus arrhizus]|nr:hypothetical protein G6F62_007250 [Rhizopus arrhizus]KAG1378756.1 hypothetical protein G6F61_005561 [Rhizopus arrhizus]
MTSTADSTCIGDLTTININREFHNDKTSAYWLPKDDEEQRRLTGENMDFEKGITVLDVGCGSGSWIMDMITDYPNCTYHGCDIIDTTNKILKIDQFTFSKGNVAQNLPYADNTFDFVHMRLLVAALREEEWPMAIGELVRVTKSGGMIQLTETEPVLNKDPSSAFYKFIDAFNSVCRQRGQNPQIALELKRLISENKDVKVIQSECRSCNMSTNSTTAKGFAWNALQGAKSFIQSIGPLIGVESKEDLSEFLEKLKYCLSHTDCYVSFHSVAAVKK